MKKKLKETLKKNKALVTFVRFLRWALFYFRQPFLFIFTAYYFIRLKKCGLPVNFSKSMIIRNPKNISIGSGCSFSNFVILDGHDEISIGNNCMMANNVCVATATHDYTIDPMNSKIVTNPTIIGDNVWIGIGATIFPGVKIGEGAVVGAMSLVRDDVAPRSIVGGIPAKLIKYRDAKED